MVHPGILRRSRGGRGDCPLIKLRLRLGRAARQARHSGRFFQMMSTGWTTAWPGSSGVALISTGSVGSSLLGKASTTFGTRQYMIPFVRGCNNLMRDATDILRSNLSALLTSIPLFLAVCFVIGWSLEGDNWLVIIPPAGTLMVIIFEGFMRLWVFEKLSKYSTLICETTNSVAPAPFPPNRHVSLRAAKNYLGIFGWIASVMGFATTLLALLVLSLYILLFVCPIVNPIFSYSLICLAFISAVFLYFDPVLPQTDRIIDNCLRESSAVIVKTTKNIFAAAGAFAIVSIAGANAVIITCFLSCDEQQIYRTFFHNLLYLHAITLAFSVLNIFATHYLPSTNVDEEDGREIGIFCQGISLYLGAYLTMILVVVHVPVAFIAYLFVSNSDNGYFGLADVAALFGPVIVSLAGAYVGRRSLAESSK